MRKKVGFYTFSTYFDGRYKSKRFSAIIDKLVAENLLGNLVGLPEETRHTGIQGEVSYFYFNKVLDRIRFPRFVDKRNIAESLFDCYANWKMDGDNNTIIITSIRMNLTATKALRKGKFVIMEASEMNPVETQIRLLAEFDRIGIRENSVYVNNSAISSFKRSVENTSALITFTSHSKSSFIKHGLPEDRIRCITPDVVKWHTPEIRTKIEQASNVIFVTTANHSLIKGTHKLIEAWSKIQSKISAELWIIGNLSSSIKKLISENRIDTSGIKFYGALNTDEIRNIYLSKKCVGVLLSLAEGGPRSVLEYLGCGIPVIVTEPCTMDLVSNEKNGLVLPYDCSIDQVVYSINRFLMDASLYTRMSLYNQQHLFPDKQDYSERVLDIIRSL